MNKLLAELKRRNVLRVAALYLVSAWLVAQIADVVIGLADLPATVGRPVLIILALGFPVAVVLAWAFEWTPAGIRRDSDAEEASVAAPLTHRRLDYVIISLLSVALVYFVATHDWKGAPNLTSASIAVLPFENRSAQADDLYFTDGIHDDLLTQLAKISALTVISRTSVMRYRETKQTIPEIARALGVATILEGGVQRAGKRVRINLQLIEAATDRHLWAETYDRELTADNVFAIQSEIATTIAGVLHAKLLPGERERINTIPTHNLEAYDAYLLGRRALARRNQDEMERARDYFREAIKLDDGFALAYAGLADSLGLLAAYSGGNGNFIDEAETAARRALELDPELGEAHTSLGLARRFRGAPLEEYGPYLERGVQLAPGSADARKWYANYFADTGRDEESLYQLSKAVELDPMSPIVRVNLGENLLKANRKAEALASFEKALEIDPGFFPAIVAVTALHSIDQSLVFSSRAYRNGERDPRSVMGFTLAYLILGDPDRAGQWTEHLERVAPGSVPAKISRLNSNLYAGREETYEVAAELLPSEVPVAPIPTRLLMMRDLASGNPEAARLRYEQQYPDLMQDDPQVGENYRPAIDIAMLLKFLGEDEKANTLLERSLQYIEGRDNPFEHSIFAARAHAVRGDGEAALRELRKAIDAGWRTQWWFYLKLDPVFDDLRDDARFTAMADEMSANMAAALEEVRQLEASGDIVLPPDT